MEKTVDRIFKRWIILMMFSFILTVNNLSYAQYWQECNGPPQLYSVSSMVVNSNNVLFAFGSGTFVCSKDNGQSWTRISLDLPGLIPPLKLAVHNSIVFAVVNNIGVYKSTNDGTTWVKKNNGLTTLRLTSICSSQNGELFVSTEDGMVFASNDLGEQWLPLSSTLPDSLWIYSIACRSDIIFAGTYSGIFKSTDNGFSWSNVNSTAVSVGSIQINSSGKIFAGVSGKVLRSVDNGNSWQEVLAYNSSNSVRALFIDHNDWIYVGSGDMGVLRSKDAGNTWNSLGLNENHIESIAVNSTGYIYAGYSESGIFRTINNGEEWTQLFSGYIDLMNTRVEKLDVNNQGNLFAQGRSYNSLYRSSDNGLHWLNLNVIPFDSFIAPNNDILVWEPDANLSLSSDNGDNWSFLRDFGDGINIFVANGEGHIFAQGYWGGRTTSYGDLYRSTDNGISWNPVGFNHIELTSISLGYSNYAFAATNNGVYRSADNGATWYIVNNGPGGSINFFYSTDQGGKVYAAGTEGLFYSNNFGLDWSLLASGLPSSNILCFAADSNTAFYVGTEFELYRSTDGVNNWTSMELTSKINSITFNDKTHIFVTTSNGVFRSIDNGMTFFLFDSGLPGPVSSLILDAEGYAFTINSGKIYRTINPTTAEIIPQIEFQYLKAFKFKNELIFEWKTSSENYVEYFEIMVFDELSEKYKTIYKKNALHNEIDNLYIAAVEKLSSNAPIKKYLLDAVFSDSTRSEPLFLEVSPSLPARFSISQNYPNPFNDITKIDFNLPEREKVKIETYNIIGQVIKSHFSGWLDEGFHTFSIDLSNFSSGLYIYKITAGHNYRTRKMVLIK